MKGMMNMNMQSLMAQARKLQGDIEKITKEIENTTFKYENDYVLIEGKGNNTINVIKIKNNQILEDSEMLEDMIQVGVNDILKQIKSTKDKKLGKYTVSVKNLSVQKVPESDSSYLVRWIEEVVKINSAEYQEIPMSGTFSYTKLPAKEEDMLINPLGLYITGFDFVQDAASVNAGNKVAGSTNGSAGNNKNIPNSTNENSAASEIK